MADIAHTMPAAVTLLDGSEFGLVRPGLQQTAFISGRYLSRDWHGYDVREYDLNPSIFEYSDTALEEWEAFWHHINGGADEGYIVEPISETHRELICGGLADGTKTTFPVPVYGGSAVTVFVDGVPQESSAYTVHSAANMLGENGASAADADYILNVDATDADASGVSADGLTSVKVIPAGGAAPTARIYLTDAASVTVGESYTGVASWLATASSAQNYNAQIWWFTSGDVYISTNNGSDVSTSAGAWMTSSVTATAPATAAKAVAGVRRNDTSGTDPFYVDCFALCPGDYTRWHLPSQSPGLVEFGTAPASGARITATATGQRIARCRFEPGSRWSRSASGHATHRSIRAVEVVEF